ECQAYVVIESNHRISGAIGHADSVALPLRESKIYRSGRRGFPCVAIKRQMARGYLQLLFGSLSGRHTGSCDVNLHLAFAQDCAGLRIVAAFASMDVIVTAGVAPVDRDPHVLEHGAVLVLEFGGVGRAYG